MNQAEIVIFKASENPDFQIEVRLEDETVWLTQAQLVDLFNATKQNISLHISNIFKEGELDAMATVKEYLTVQMEGNRKVRRKLAFYNLDVIISVGYRVKSHRGTQFRIWANNVLKEYLLKGHVINHRLDKVERKLAEHDLKPHGYLIVTLHRPANVDQQAKFFALLEAILNGAKGLPVVFPVHPRTRQVIETLGKTLPETLILMEPLGYLEFNYLVQNAKGVITDSGGITEETTVMGVPCMTLRDNTERPETITEGTNELLGTKPEAIKPAMEKLFEGNWKNGTIPHLWDGKAAERIVESLLIHLTA